MKVSMTKVKAYILANITGYEGALEDKTDAEKVQGLFDAFYSEYSFRIKQVGLLNAIRDWLQGLPSVINVEYRNCKIEALAIDWGMIKETSREETKDKALDAYWINIAYGIIVLGGKYKAIK